MPELVRKQAKLDDFAHVVVIGAGFAGLSPTQTRAAAAFGSR
ncbi:hypothetical protein [Arenibaculum pallidiluteum]|nr:hypothetical protein [Arenibaculum pallidiluteum]